MIETSSGEEVLKFVEEDHPDLIIMDEKIPSPVGTLSLLSLIREETHAQILVIGDGNYSRLGRGLIEVAFLQGADAYVSSEDLTKELLHARIHALMRRATPAG